MIAQIEFKGLPITRQMHALGVTAVMTNPVNGEAWITYRDHVTGDQVQEKVPLVVALWFKERL
jgi:hypothetical protein